MTNTDPDEVTQETWTTCKYKRRKKRAKNRGKPKVTEETMTHQIRL